MFCTCFRYCTYVLMEQFSSMIVDLEIVDKRETKGISTNMETEGLRRLLLKLKDLVNISEIITDASSSVQTLIENMKGAIFFVSKDKYNFVLRKK